MACAGIDFGARNAVVAIARRGGIDICCNEVSNRATPTVVSFQGNERSIGESGATIAAQNAKNTAAYLQRLLGVPFGTAFSAEEAERLTCTVLADPTAGCSAVNVSYSALDGPESVEHVFTFEALTAMLLTNLMTTASNEYKAPVKDLVISVPSYYTEGQRRALLNAAAIADYNVLRVVNEHAATALSYGIFRTKQLPEKDPVKVAFVDVGEASTTVSVASFTNSRCDVIAVASDPTLGGRNLDDILVHKFAADFKTTYSIDVLSKPKPASRLRKSCEKMKKVLSTNAQAPLNIECIMNDVDVRGSMKREEFETLAEPLVAKLRTVCQKAIKAANLKTDEKLVAVEIVGGSTRVPAFKTAIAEVFSAVGAPLSTTLNADECIARGCALMSAMLSPAFRVRDYVVSDIATDAFDAEKVFTNGNPPEKIALVPEGNALPCLKALTFKSPGPLTVKIRYSNPEKLPFGADAPDVCSYLLDAPSDPEAKVRAKIRVTANGTVEMASAQLMKEVEVEEEVVIKQPKPVETSNGPKPDDVPMPDANKVPEKKDEEMADATAEGKKETPSEAETPEEKPANGNVEDKEETPDPTPMEEAPVAPIVEKRMVKKMKTTDLQATPLPGIGCSLTLDQIMAATEKEAQMRANDLYIKERSEAMNSLEAYVYDLRSRVDDYGDLKDFGPASLRQELKTDLDDAESWIYSEEAESASKSSFVERKSALQKKANPLLLRKKEFDERPVRIKVLEASIDNYKKILVPDVEEYAHITDDNKMTARKCLEGASLWLAQEKGKQQKLGKDVDPSLTCEALNAKMKEVETVCKPIMQTPKPKPKEEEKKPEEEAKKEESKKEEAEDQPEQNGMETEKPKSTEEVETEDGKMEVEEPPVETAAS
ncbi:Heat shock protein 70kD [Gracilaria domingensis]|nr:Heat shock protein 70kD [Gracilaria domingensis]